uniref:Carbonyl reductase 1 n=1 Tax=Mus spicilegus TaxID=10103 RepID=A0A8C6GT97_MUSSI
MLSWREVALRVALVTGANKGIGFAITRDLCQQFSGDVVLTARDEARGLAAVQKLQAEGLSPRFHQLDINDPQHICALCDFLLKEYGGLDVLVNNAGIGTDLTHFHILREAAMKTNFFGTQAVCTELLPLIKTQGESDGCQQFPIKGRGLWEPPHSVPECCLCTGNHSCCGSVSQSSCQGQETLICSALPQSLAHIIFLPLLP